jgi:hypothetical protein
MKIKKCIPLRPYLKLSEATRVFWAAGFRFDSTCHSWEDQQTVNRTFSNDTQSYWNLENPWWKTCRRAFSVRHLPACFWHFQLGLIDAYSQSKMVETYQ